MRVSVGKSQALYSWEGGRAGAAALLSVGGVRVDLPQHPVALHGVMTRSSRQLSSTLQVPPRRHINTLLFFIVSSSLLLLCRSWA